MRNAVRNSRLFSWQGGIRLPILAVLLAMSLMLGLGSGLVHAQTVINLSDLTSDYSISADGDYYITGSTTSYGIVVTAANATITLDNAAIDVSGISQKCALNSGVDVTLYLIGVNSLKSGDSMPGIRIIPGNQLTIDQAPGSTGSLTVIGGSGGAGIGREASNLGTMTLSTGSVTINGGTVIANGGYLAAGIGGGYEGHGGTVMLNGGVVTATGGFASAGIGGGYWGNGGTVTISGGTVTASGGSGGAGIGGGGYYGVGGAVRIDGGSILARGSNGGENIGHGVNVSGSGTLTNAYGQLVHETIVPNAVEAVNPQPVDYQFMAGSAPYEYNYLYCGSGHAGGDTNLYFYLPAGTTLMKLTSSQTPSLPGDLVTFTATLAPVAATGTVQFYADNTLLDWPVPLSVGIATLTTNALSVGTHVITAEYTSDNGYLACIANEVTQVVESPLVVTVDPGTVEYSDRVKLTAVCQSGVTVYFAIGGQSVGKAVCQKDGIATLWVKVQNRPREEAWTVIAYTLDAEKKREFDASTQLQVTKETACGIYVGACYARPGQSFPLIVQLKDESADASFGSYRGVPVTLTITSRSGYNCIHCATAPATGTLYFGTLQLPQKGIYTVTASIPANTYYNEMATPALIVVR